MKIIITEEMLKELVKTELNEWQDYGYIKPQQAQGQSQIPRFNFAGFNLQDFLSGTKWVRKPDNYVEVDKVASVMPSQYGVSKEMLNQLCLFETSKNFGYTMGPIDLKGKDNGDAGGHLTYGYGLLRHPLNGKFMDQIKKVWTQKELESLYVATVKKMSDKVREWAQMQRVQLNQNQIDAMTSACFNFGTGFLKKKVCQMIAQNPNDRRIHSVWSNLSNGQARRYPGLLIRRQKEANWYFGSVIA